MRAFEIPLPQVTQEPRGPQIMPVLGGPVRTGRPETLLGDPSAGLRILLCLAMLCLAQSNWMFWDVSEEPPRE
jgi:hypothetical protein